MNVEEVDMLAGLQAACNGLTHETKPCKHLMRLRELGWKVEMTIDDEGFHVKGKPSVNG